MAIGNITSRVLAAGAVLFANLNAAILASQAQAEAGTATDVLMTPQRVAQAIAAKNIMASATVPTATGTAVNFTGLPAGVKRITIGFNGVSLSGSDNLLVRLGTVGGLETTGYTSTSTGNTAPSATNGFIVRGAGTTVFNYVVMTLVLVDPVNNIWVEAHSGQNVPGFFVAGGGGKTALAGVLDRISILASGTDTFDAGSVNILYEV